MTLTLVSSNENKLLEFKRYGLTDIVIEKGLDLKEVDADDAETVAIYKALAAGPGHMVEDTSLLIDAAEMGVNVRWLLDVLPEHSGKEAIWQVYLAVHTGTEIELYRGRIHGRIANGPVDPEAFGFDSLFVPYSASNYTLHELEAMGRKDAYSARKKAIDNFLSEKPFWKVAVKDIPEWVDGYQNES